MKIHEYYRETANMSINGSIAALVPALLIIVSNLTFFQNRQIMLLTIPFLFYSIISFQTYLLKLNQAFSINRKMNPSFNLYHSIFQARFLLVIFMNTSPSSLLFFFPNGHQAGVICRHRENGFSFFRRTKTYAFYNNQHQLIGLFKIKGRKSVKIEVYDRKKEYIGCFVKMKHSWLKWNKNFFDQKGKYLGEVEGSRFFMDEKVLNQSKTLVCRLRRGWLPIECIPRFPEANTPVLSFSEELPDREKLLRMSFLIHEYFIER